MDPVPATTKIVGTLPLFRYREAMRSLSAKLS